MEQTAKEKKTDFNLDPEEMIRAGLHFGHRTSKYHPKMEPFLHGVRNTVHILDVEKTVEKFKEALKFIQKLILEDKVILFVGTKIQVKDLVKKTAEECGLPYVTERWLGGTFTNLKTVQKRIEYFKELEQKKKEGELEKYSKKERADFDKELKDLEMKFGGIKNLNRLPDAVFIIDMKQNEIAVREASKKGVKIIGIVDTNIDPSLADFPIPANDDSISSVQYILDKIKEVILKTKKETESKKSETQEE